MHRRRQVGHLSGGCKAVIAACHISAAIPFDPFCTAQSLPSRQARPNHGTFFLDSIGAAGASAGFYMHVG